MSIQNKFNKVTGLKCTNEPDYGKNSSSNVWNCKVRYTKDTLEGSKQTHYNIIAGMVDMRNESQVILNDDTVNVFFDEEDISCVTVLDKISKRTTLECGYER